MVASVGRHQILKALQSISAIHDKDVCKHDKHTNNDAIYIHTYIYD